MLSVHTVFELHLMSRYVLIEALQFINQEPDISQDKKAVIEAELAALKVTPR